MLLDTLYKEANARNITNPHPSSYNTFVTDNLGILSNALEKSTYTRYNGKFFLTHVSIIIHKATMCSIHPLPACAPACSLSGINHCLSRLYKT